MLTQEESSATQSKIVTYWFDALKRAGKKQPTGHWEIAEERLKAKTRPYLDGLKDFDERPVVNDLRNHYEGSLAYLDQKAPSFDVAARPAFAGDEVIENRAKCDKRYLEYVWHEQECQKAQSQKLNSSLIRNVGFTMPVFDLKKWMPSIRYLPPRDVRFESDCGGILERVSWQAYKEDMSLEELKASNADPETGETLLTKEEISQIKRKASSTLTEKETDDAADEIKEQNLVVTVWHIFARNDAAVRLVEKEDDETLPAKRLAEELNLLTPRRYLQLVEGLPRPLKNEDKWPFELDHNELMITHLQMNKEPENLYGFTDYQQMVRMDDYSDKLMSYIEADAYFSSIRKYVGGKKNPSNENIEEFLNQNRRSFMEDMLDENGEPKIKEIRAGAPTPALMEQYNLVHDQSKEASGLSELQLEKTAEFKEVTAIAVRFMEWKLHQRVNLRLGGPRGYEENIKQDAVKMLEIAHQMVPRESHISVMEETESEEEGKMVTEEIERIKVLPWPDAQKALMAGGQLLKLGVDAIVGPELAKYWVTTDEVPLEVIRLSTEVMVTPGSTRTITDQQKAAEMKDYLINVLWPTMYEPLQVRGLALSAKLHAKIGRFMGIDRMEDYLPTDDDFQQMQEAQEKPDPAEQQKLALGEQKMIAAQQKAGNEQRAADAALLRDGAKAEVEIEKANAKGTEGGK